MMKQCLAAIFAFILMTGTAQAYVGPGLVVVGNLLGPFVLLIPFLLLLAVLFLRWWIKKLKRRMSGTFVLNQEDADIAKNESDENS